MSIFNLFRRSSSNENGDELDLIYRSQQGDVDAIAQLLKLYDQRLHKLARDVGWKFGLWALTEDLVAEGWVGVWLGLPGYSPRPNTPPWAYFQKYAHSAMTVYCRDQRGLTEDGRKYYVKVLRFWGIFQQEYGRTPSEQELADFSNTSLAIVKNILFILRTSHYPEGEDEEGNPYLGEISNGHALGEAPFEEPADYYERLEAASEQRMKLAAHWERVMAVVSQVVVNPEECTAWVSIYVQRKLQNASWCEIASRLQAPEVYHKEWAEFHQRIVHTSALPWNWAQVSAGLPPSRFQQHDTLRRWFSRIDDRLDGIWPSDLPR